MYQNMELCKSYNNIPDRKCLKILGNLALYRKLEYVRVLVKN